MRGRLAGVADVSISQRAQTVAVTFQPGTRLFSVPAFRAAVGEAGVDVVSLQVEVCGVAELQADRLLLRTSPDMSLRLRDAAPRPGDRICVEGRLDEAGDVHALHVTRMRPATQR